MTVAAQFQDRREAGRLLAEKLQHIGSDSKTLVLAARVDGVPVAYEVAKALDAPLDIFLVEKIVAPGHKKIVLGHIASGGVRIFHDDVIQRVRVPEVGLHRLARECERRLEQRERASRGDRAPELIEGRHAILVEDGFTIGEKVRSELLALRARRPRSITIAAPVGSPQTARELERDADEVVCLMMPEGFVSVGAWYADFIQITDEEARRLLREVAAGRTSQANAAANSPSN